MPYLLSLGIRMFWPYEWVSYIPLIIKVVILDQGLQIDQKLDKKVNEFKFKSWLSI